MSVAVRESTGADVEAVIDVAEAAWFAAYGGFLDPATIEQGLRENYDAELLEAAVRHDDIAFFVADADGAAGEPAVAGETEGSDDATVVGFASAEQTWADEVELHTIYVHPDRWNEGVGAALLSRVESWAREQDVDRIAASVLAENAVGVGFFEAAGFVRGTEAKGVVAGEFHPEYEYEYPLSAPPS